MRKKLDTRFPAARIKKIMQADEDVGKIALAVPVLVSKALELFLQDLCDRTYEVTLQRGAKTMSSLHLKHCVQSYNVFDFLREIVSKVPDYSHGHGHSDGSADHRNPHKRKSNMDEGNESDEEFKRSRMVKPQYMLKTIEC
ncbi:Dr1-associated corepressor [Linum grandiflorum]